MAKFSGLRPEKDGMNLAADSGNKSIIAKTPILKSKKTATEMAAVIPNTAVTSPNAGIVNPKNTAKKMPRKIGPVLAEFLCNE